MPIGIRVIDKISEQSDVAISSLQDSQALVYNSSIQKWENRTIIVSANPAGSDREIQFNQSDAFSSSSNLKYTTDNSLLIIQAGAYSNALKLKRFDNDIYGYRADPFVLLSESDFIIFKITYQGGFEASGSCSILPSETEQVPLSITGYDISSTSDLTRWKDNPLGSTVAGVRYNGQIYANSFEGSLSASYLNSGTIQADITFDQGYYYLFNSNVDFNGNELLNVSGISGINSISIDSLVSSSIYTNSIESNNIQIVNPAGGSGTGSYDLLNISNNNSSWAGSNYFYVYDDVSNTELFKITSSGVVVFPKITGSSPFIVASTTKVTNLNADLLDGLNSTDFASASHSHNLNEVLGYGNETTGNSIQLTEGDRIVVGQFGAGLSKGTFDTGRSGDKGVSLICGVGIELNWQAGYLRSMFEGGNGDPIALYSDSEIIYSSLVSTTPTDGRSLVDKNYVDGQLLVYVPYTGGTGVINFGGSLMLNGPISGQDTNAYGAIADALVIRGGEGTAGSNGGGNLTLRGGNSFTGDAEPAGDVIIKGGINTFSTTTGGYVRIFTLDTERITVRTDGNIGINNNNPSELLDINGNVNLQGLLKLSSSSGTTGQVLASNGSSNPTWENVSFTNLADIPTTLSGYGIIDAVSSNSPITGSTRTKITYDSKGLVTAGVDATTADISDSTNRRYITDAQLTVISNTSGTNTGDQTTITGNAGSATVLQTARTIGITGDATWTSPLFNGSSNVTAALTLATVNSNVGSFGSTSVVPIITVNGKGLITAVSTGSITPGSIGAQTSSSNLTSLSSLSYVSASFVKMTSSGTFSLDTNTYLTGNQSITLSGDVTGSGTTSISTTLANNVVTFAKFQQIATGFILGRSTASTGNVEVITVGSGLSLSGGTLTATAGGTGTVTSVSVTTANGISGSVANDTTTPAITLNLGDITPNSVNATTTVSSKQVSTSGNADGDVPFTITVPNTQTGKAFIIKRANGQEIFSLEPRDNNEYYLNIAGVPFLTPVSGRWDIGSRQIFFQNGMGFGDSGLISCSGGGGAVAIYIDPRETGSGANQGPIVLGARTTSLPNGTTALSNKIIESARPILIHRSLSTDILLTVKGAASQSASLTEWQDDSGTVLASISSSGAITGSNLSGTNTGDQTTITGNAGSATILQTARNIQGVAFDGSANINIINGTGFIKATGTTLSYDNSTYLTANQSITLSGDVTGSGTTSISTTIANNAVNFAKMQTVSTGIFLGRSTAGTGNIETLSTSTVKTMLSLNLVENTALSTWAGSTNLTTLGTITTGTWNGSVIGVNKGGTGLSSLGSPNEILIVNGDGTDFTWTGFGTDGSIIIDYTGGSIDFGVDPSSIPINLLSGILTPSKGGTGVANNNASTLTISGNFATTFTITGITSVTLPTSGTLSTLAGSESLTNKKLGSLTSNGFVKTSGGDGTLSVDTNAYLTANQSITLSGDVIGSGTTSISTTIADNIVTFAKMQTISTNRLLGRSTASTGNVEQISIGSGLSLSGGTLSATGGGGGGGDASKAFVVAMAIVL